MMYNKYINIYINNKKTSSYHDQCLGEIPQEYVVD